MATAKRLTAYVDVDTARGVSGLRRVGRETDSLAGRMRSLEGAALAAGAAILATAGRDELNLGREQVRAELQTGLPAGALDPAFDQVRRASGLTGEALGDIAPLVTIGVSRGLSGDDLNQFILGGSVQQLLYDTPASVIGEATLGLAQQFDLPGGYLQSADIIGGAVQGNPRLASELLPFLTRPGAGARELGLSLEDTLAAAVVQVQQSENPGVAFTQLRSLLTELVRQTADPKSTLRDDYGLDPQLAGLYAGGTLGSGGLGGIVDFLAGQPGFEPFTALGRAEAAQAFIALRDNPEDLARARAAIGGTTNVLSEAAQRFGDDPATIGLQFRREISNVVGESFGDVGSILSGDISGVGALLIPGGQLEDAIGRTGRFRTDPTRPFDAGGNPVLGLARTPEAAGQIAQRGLLASLGDAIGDALSGLLGGGSGGGLPGTPVPGVTVVNNITVAPDAVSKTVAEQVADDLADTAGSVVPDYQYPDYILRQR